MSEHTPASGRDILARIKPTRRVVDTSVCLSHQLVAEFIVEDEKLQTMHAEAAGSNRNAGKAASSTAIKKQAKVVRDLEDRIVDETIAVRFQALSPAEFRALCADHPPRQTDQLDIIVGYHRDNVLDELVHRCMVSPVFEDCATEGCEHDDCGTWQQVVAVINPAEWDHLREKVNEANSGVVDAPKSRLASLILDRRASTSQ